jgi:hypothetical protein
VSGEDLLLRVSPSSDACGTGAVACAFNPLEPADPEAPRSTAFLCSPAPPRCPVSACDATATSTRSRAPRPSLPDGGSGRSRPAGSGAAVAVPDRAPGQPSSPAPTQPIGSFCSLCGYDVGLLQATGTGFTSVLPRVSINDDDQVAFVGAEAGGAQKAYVVDAAGGPRAVSFGGGSRTFLGASINNQTPPRVASRDLQGTYFLRKWPDDGSLSFTVVGRSGALFDGAIGFPDINDQGVVAFPAAQGTQSLLLAGTAEPPTELARYFGTVSLRPSISNDDQVVVRDGQGRIVSLLYPSGAQTVIAGSSQGFTLASIGSRPGISKNGDAVAFVGDQGSGPGIYVSIRDGASRSIFPMALSPEVSAVDGEQRAGVIASGTLDPGDELAVSVVFAGTRGGLQGVYLVPAVFAKENGVIQQYLGNIVRISAIGEVVGGRTITSFDLYDPINDNQSVAFWAGFSDGTSGVVLADSTCN